MDQAGHRERRGQLLAGLHRRVLEVAASNGINLTHYPPEITGVPAAEPEPHLRALTHEKANAARAPIEVVDGTASHPPTDDANFDAVVAPLVLCTVPDVPSALAEKRRVLVPGGELRIPDTRIPGPASPHILGTATKEG
jgi:ubiquinone/menaquinone biosynthesis C-methylase UbiE